MPMHQPFFAPPASKITSAAYYRLLTAYTILSFTYTVFSRLINIYRERYTRATFFVALVSDKPLICTKIY